jgi:hypothetical protein
MFSWTQMNVRLFDKAAHLPPRNKYRSLPQDKQAAEYRFPLCVSGRDVPLVLVQMQPSRCLLWCTAAATRAVSGPPRAADRAQPLKDRCCVFYPCTFWALGLQLGAQSARPSMAHTCSTSASSAVQAHTKDNCNCSWHARNLLSGASSLAAQFASTVGQRHICVPAAVQPTSSAACLAASCWRHMQDHSKATAAQTTG